MLNGHCLWGQTFLALVLLGLAGGWVLWPFRQGKPYLWLAAPLAGLTLLGLCLTALNYVAGLPVAVAALSMIPLAVATLYCLLDYWRQAGGGKLPGWRMALAAFLGVSLWGTVACNRASLLEGEPTIACCEGSDAWGYSQAANWLLRHPGEQPGCDPDQPADLFVHLLFLTAGDRPATFCLIALAALVRGTTAPFSYDWSCGVVLAAGILGLIGLFATSRRGLLLLLLAGLLSAWLTLSRTGYFGKLLGYTSCLLLCPVFWEAWARPSMARWALAGLLGLGGGLCLNPVTPLAVLALVFGGLGFVLILHRLIGRALPEQPFGHGLLLRHLLTGLTLFGLMVGPLLVVHVVLYRVAVPTYREYIWPRLVPIALDLDNAGLPLVGETLSLHLSAVALGLTGVLFLIGFLQRNAQAQGLLLCVGVIPLAWLLDNKSLYTFQGILFPLTAIAAVLIVQRQVKQGPSRLARWAALALAVGLIGLRAPQFQQACLRYVRFREGWPACYRQSDVAALEAIIGDRSVDLLTGDVHTAALICTELASRDVRVHFPEPAWTRLFAWTKPHYGWKHPEVPPKGDFTLTDGAAWVPEGTVRFRHPKLLLAEDGDALTFHSIHSPRFVLWDEQGRPCFQQGVRPSTIHLSNGTGGTVSAVIVAEARTSPGYPAGRMLTLGFDGQTEQEAIPPGRIWSIRIPVMVPPGIHGLSVCLTGPKGSLAEDDGQELLLLTDLRLESVGGNDRLVWECSASESED